jgi:hypothetical protein
MEQKQYTLGFYLVAFLDVQGQQEKFRQLRVPTTPAEEQAVSKVLLETAGFVDGLREQLKAEFKENDERLSKSKTTQTESLQPEFIGFSDCFVMSVALWDAKENLTFFIKIYSALAAACNAMMTCFAKEHALRGGIDIGLGAEIARGEIYGTALAKAYLLECRAAEYPRVLIGDELWKYLSEGVVEFESKQTPDAEKICDVIKKTMAFTCIDADGRRILDYLGNFVKTIGWRGAETVIEPAYNFVVAEHARLTAAGNDKLSVRYARLLRYFESRISLWGISQR